MVRWILVTRLREGAKSTLGSICEEDCHGAYPDGDETWRK